jgi:hypothetical protein
MFGAVKAKKPLPAPRVAHQISPFRKGPGWFAFSSRPFGHSQADGAVLLWVTEDLCSRQQLLCFSSGTRSRACAMRTDSSGFAPLPLTELDFCALHQ